MRTTSLVETGTHIIVGTELGPYKRSEQNMTAALIDAGLFTPEMLILADRNFYGYNLWNKAVSTGAKLVWRVKSDLKLPVEAILPDKSYFSTVRNSRNRRKSAPVVVRVIEYDILDLSKKDDDYRSITNIFDYNDSPADELAKLYHERWEIETLFGEVKVGLVNNHSIMRSKTPDLIYQEFWAMLINHFGIRHLMAEVAWANGFDPDDLSFKGAMNIIKRKGLRIAVSPPRAEG